MFCWNLCSLRCLDIGSGLFQCKMFFISKFLWGKRGHFKNELWNNSFFFLFLIFPVACALGNFKKVQWIYKAERKIISLSATSKANLLAFLHPAISCVSFLGFPLLRLQCVYSDTLHFPHWEHINSISGVNSRADIFLKSILAFTRGKAMSSGKLFVVIELAFSRRIEDWA